MNDSIFDLLTDIMDRCRSYLNEHNQLPFPADEQAAEVEPVAPVAEPEPAPAPEPEWPEKRKAPKRYTGAQLGLRAVHQIVAEMKKEGADPVAVRRFVEDQCRTLGIAVSHPGAQYGDNRPYIKTQAADLIMNLYKSTL